MLRCFVWSKVGEMRIATPSLEARVMFKVVIRNATQDVRTGADSAIAMAPMANGAWAPMGIVILADHRRSRQISNYAT